MIMSETLTRKEWERCERAEADFRADPARYRSRLRGLLLTGILLVDWPIILLLAVCIGFGVFGIQSRILFPSVAFWVILIVLRPQSLSIRRLGEKRLPELDGKTHPGLFALVRETAEAIGAPRIHRVYLIPDTFNAYMSVVRPFIPGLRSNELFLGYPLLVTANIRTLRGILTHELYHARQGGFSLDDALFHIRRCVENFGVLRALTKPYLRRFDRLMAPIQRARERAADRAIAERFGLNLLREALVTLELRGADAADFNRFFLTIYETWNPEDSSAPPPDIAAALRTTLRAPLPETETRRRLERALRAIIPPLAEHPTLADRTMSTRVEELMPFAVSDASALESVFGSGSALDAVVNAWLQPFFLDWAKAYHSKRASALERLEALAAGTPTPDTIIERISILRFLDRPEEAAALLRSARENDPANPALETVDLADRLSSAPSAEAGAPFAARLETLLTQEPMMRVWAEDPLFTHYLEIGDAERIKRLLDLCHQSDKPLEKRLFAELKPTDDLCALPISDAEREMIQAFPRRYVRAVYPVLRKQTGTGVAQSFYVIRPGWLYSSDILWNLNTSVSATVIPGRRALFRRFAELGIEPIPISRRGKEVKRLKG